MNVDGLVWRKSTKSSGNGQCFEVAERDDGSRLVRDSKDHGRGPVLAFTAGEWRAFVDGVKAGEFD
jgi:hypothetical protein